MNLSTQTGGVRFASGLAIAVLLSLTACDGGDDDEVVVVDPPPTTGPPVAGTTALRLAMTDAPQCGYDHVFITVSAIKVNQSGAAGDNDAGWYTITFAGLPKKIDLLGLTNGILEELGQTNLPAGTYTQMRLMLLDNGNQAPYANAVVPTGGGGQEAALTTPSAQQSGLKVNVNMTVQEGQLADFVLDFDACKSVVVAGNSGKYNLKPQITVLPRVTNAMAVDGYVSNWTPGTIVSVQLDGKVIRSTQPASGGFFAMPYLPQAGAHELVITGPDIATQVVTAVPVSSTSITHVSLSGGPIALSPSASQNVSGTATAGNSIPEATVSARQTIAGKTVELISRSVNSETGAYSFTLPIAPVLSAPYVVPPLASAWASDSAIAGQYTIRSVVSGLADQNLPANLFVGPATVNFAY